MLLRGSEIKQRHHRQPQPSIADRISSGSASVFGEQFPDPNLQSTSDLQQAPDRGIPKPAFDTRQVGSIQVGSFRQPFLRPALRVPQLAYPLTKGFDDRRL